jgi:Type II secretion system (T2SS), protein N
MPASRSASRDVKPQHRPPRRWPLVLSGIVVLAAATVLVLPASMITHFLPAQVHAEDFSGSLLHGAAGRLRVNAREAGALEWRLHPFSLLRLAMVADIHWVKVGFVIDGTVELGARGVAAHDIKGGGPIDSLGDLGLAAGWKGNANLEFAAARSDFRKLDSAVGKIDVANLSAVDIAAGEDLGSYELQLSAGAVAPDGTITANVADTGGPVEARAQIQFSPATRTGMLSGTLKERPEASLSLRNQLNSLSQLRPRDAAGRFPVELEFTF